jgi:hypothetical protein
VPPLIGELKRRGLGGKLATEFIAAHPAEYIEQKLDYLDFLLDNEPPKNPGGWLRVAIEQDYGPPSGYASKEERERQRQAAEGLRRQQLLAAAEDRAKQEAGKREKAARERADAAVARLSAAERQAIEAELYAKADARMRDMYDNPPTPTFRDALMHRMLIEHFMASEEA